MDYLDSKCHSPFNITYSPEVQNVLIQIMNVANEVYGQSVIWLSPFNVAANLFSAFILLTKQMRNPFNLILSIMCLECGVPVLVRATSVYRQIIAARDCNVQTQTYSLALHDLIVYNSWLPFRATYTWTTAFLTFLRFRALRSKGKWEASYSLALFGSLFLACLSAAAGTPLYMINVIQLYQIDLVCQRLPVPGNEKILAPHTGWSDKQFENNCLLLNLNRGLSGILHNSLPSLLLLLSTVLLAVEISKARKGHNAVARSAKRNDDAEKAARFISIANIIMPVGFQFNYTELLTTLWFSIQNITTSCNLIIYLAMSRNFRKAVLATFFFWLKKKTSSPQVSVISVSTVATSKKY